MKPAVPAAPASVDGFAARAHARALRVDLGRDVRVLEREHWRLKGSDRLMAGSRIAGSFSVTLTRSRRSDPRGRCL